MRRAVYKRGGDTRGGACHREDVDASYSTHADRLVAVQSGRVGTRDNQSGWAVARTNFPVRDVKLASLGVRSYLGRLANGYAYRQVWHQLEAWVVCAYRKVIV